MYVECMTFKAKKGVDTNKILKELAKVYKEFWSGRDGFIRGEILKDKQMDNWKHLMYWESKENILTSLNEVGPVRESYDFFGLIDPNTVLSEIYELLGEIY